MNGLLLHGFHQITRYTYVQYNILFKYLLNLMFPVAGFLKQHLRNQTRP